MLNFKKMIVASALTLAAAMPAQADFVLDTFDYDVDLTVTSALTPANGVGTTVAGAGAFYSLNHEGGLLSNTTAATSPIAGGILGYSEGSSQDSILTIDYFVDSNMSGAFEPVDVFAGITTLDLSSEDAFYFDIVSTDGFFSVSLDVTDAFGATTSGTLQITNPVDDVNALLEVNESLLLNYDEFSGDVIDWTNVARIFTTIDSSGSNRDFILAEVGVTSVPEPSTIALLGLGLIGLGLRRRKLV